MADKEKIKEEQEPIIEPKDDGGSKEDLDYIDLYKKKNQDVEKLKAENEKLRAEKNKFIKSVLDGDTLDDKKKEGAEEDINELRKRLFNNPSDLNLNKAKDTLKLRERIIKEGGKDPFLPQGTHVQATDEDIEKAQRVADFFESCIEESNDDPEAFNALMMSKMQDSSLGMKKRR